ncbi:primosomal protein N' [Moraxella sp. Tifton1]|uniref:primosomal protein N' n=1 Tax=Moraxella oculi TaxID=2940516 RepID=UPI0020124CE8|nr:primosomal protein N' [Moraxella sp. Tifton1]MCL1623102.1 primosomal protein N' [Moraxella sp. Tifton1]
MSRPLVRVALPVPLYRLFDYLCPPSMPNLPVVGGRVQVPFGHRTLIGIVTGHIDQAGSDIPQHKLKSIKQCFDDTAIITDDLFGLAYWLASYYHHPLGETFSVMLPSLINQGNQPVQQLVLWKVAESVTDDFAQKQISQVAKKQWQIFNAIKQASSLNKSQLKELGVTKAQLSALSDKGLICSFVADASKNSLTPPKLKDTPPSLNDEQCVAFNAIKQAIDAGIYQGILLNGITGSGKTEVYLHAIWHALSAGRQVLILVPEIGLTPQTKARFTSRFNARICVLHSGMNDKERLQGWQDCRTGQTQIIIGTRSSVLYPFNNLGLIIIDEAHDTSYKQQDHLRYHACDVAMWRGHRLSIPVVLGTATPSLEQIKLSHDGKLIEYRLTKRAGDAKTPTFQMVDIRQGSRQILLSSGEQQTSLLSELSIHHIKQRLGNGEQVLIFLNRRGYAPILMCSACGWQADCPYCDAHLTLHKYPTEQLKCHHCGFQNHIPCHCPKCNSSNLQHLGLGTSKLSEQLHAIFANPQMTKQLYPIWQIDRDTMRKQGAWESMYEQILQGHAGILVGTQMIAKGHHFPNVTLVVIADADLGFLSPNFRSPEHTAQRIIQVAGRAGRAKKSGHVLIQTRQPDNPLFLTLIKHGYLAFADTLLKERRLLGLPPHAHAALISAESHDQQRARAAISHLTQALPSPNGLAKSGALDAPMNKKNNRYHTQLLLLAKDRKTLHGVLSEYWQSLLELPTSKGVKLSLDIDPMSW